MARRRKNSLSGAGDMPAPEAVELTDEPTLSMDDEVEPTPPEEPAGPVAARRPDVYPMAVCLTTCDRMEFTRRTVEAFVSHNAEAIADGRVILLHADDASRAHSVFEFVRAHGFETVGRNQQRSGAQVTRRLVVKAAKDRGCPLTFLLENDWVMCRPIPWDAVEYFASRKDCWQLRLFGQLREQHGDGWPCANYHAGKGRKDAGWTKVDDSPEPMEIGDIHACTTTCVTRTDLLLSLLNMSHSAGRMMIDSARVAGMVLRTVENVGWHIGHGPGFTTPNFVR